MTMQIRHSEPDDRAALDEIYRGTFPQEDLLPLLDALLVSDVVSLVAESDGQVVGHIVFSPCGVTGSEARVALLGPLAVAPGCQRRGIGDALIRDGLQRLKAAGFARVLVLGDPGYYGRFGFRPEGEVSPPYRLPKEWREAWQYLPLVGADKEFSGRLIAPEAWLKPELWQ